MKLDEAIEVLSEDIKRHEEDDSMFGEMFMEQFGETIKAFKEIKEMLITGNPTSEYTIKIFKKELDSSRLTISKKEGLKNIILGNEEQVKKEMEYLEKYHEMLETIWEHLVSSGVVAS